MNGDFFDFAALIVSACAAAVAAGLLRELAKDNRAGVFNDRKGFAISFAVMLWSIIFLAMYAGSHAGRALWGAA